MFSFFPSKLITLCPKNRLFSKTKVDLAPYLIFLLVQCRVRKINLYQEECSVSLLYFPVQVLHTLHCKEQRNRICVLTSEKNKTPSGGYHKHNDNSIDWCNFCFFRLPLREESQILSFVIVLIKRHQTHKGQYIYIIYTHTHTWSTEKTPTIFIF